MSGYSNGTLGYLRGNIGQFTPAGEPLFTPEVTEMTLIERAGFVEVFSNDYLQVFGKKTKDRETGEIIINLVPVSSDGNVYQTRRYRKGNLNRKKVFKAFASLDGMDLEDTETLYENVIMELNNFSQAVISNDQFSMFEIYRKLIDHAKEFGIEGEYEIDGDYLKIKAKILKKKLHELGVVVDSLKFKQWLKEYELLKVNSKSTGHRYEYMIKNEWFLIIKTMER